jgi:hypothetical protein
MPSEENGMADPKAILKILEEFDRKTVGPILDGLLKLGAHRLVLICDYHEPAGGQQQVHPVPYVLYEGKSGKESEQPRSFSEADAQRSPGGTRDASRLMSRLLSPQHG